jgi:hypothetical protein
MKTDTNKQEMIERNKTKSELKQFMEENVRLKRIIAEQVIELARKDEELKKSNSQYRR